jgi:hypothetical protein
LANIRQSAERYRAEVCFILSGGQGYQAIYIFQTTNTANKENLPVRVLDKAGAHNEAIWHKFGDRIVQKTLKNAPSNWKWGSNLPIEPSNSLLLWINLLLCCRVISFDPLHLCLTKEPSFWWQSLCRKHAEPDVPSFSLNGSNWAAEDIFRPDRLNIEATDDSFQFFY